MKKAVYVRVSTKSQKTQSQMLEIKNYLAQQDISITSCVIYQDKQSGKNMKRPQLLKLQRDMLDGKITHVYLYALDRLSRAGTESVMAFLALANSKGVSVEFVCDQYLNHKEPLIKNILITVLSELARKEREKVISRVKAGIENARNNGKRLGRPPVVNPDRVISLREQGMSLQQIATKLGIAKSTVQQILKRNGV